MKLKEIYRETIRKGIEQDPRGKKAITQLLKETSLSFKKLETRDKELFDADALFNPFADTRIVNGDENAQIRSIIMGIDVAGEELLLVDRLKEKGTAIDLVVAHHPLGRAYANFYEVMDLQTDMFSQKGVNISFAEGLLKERKAQVGRRLSAANHQRPVDIAKWLDINLMCAHTAADNCAYQFIKGVLKKQKPKTVGDILDILLTIPEYKAAARGNNPPQICIGDKKSRADNIHVEFTGGTEGPQNIYEKLSAAGVDTIVAMHQSEEHFKKCREARINVVVASHIASDNIGMNIICDHLLTRGKLTIYEFSGFNRYSRIKGKK